MMRVQLPDGVPFINEDIGWWDKTFHKDLSRWVRVPHDREPMHFLIVGDSGTGKSVAIRQLLSQIWERGEAAIVYDPAMEYLPQFYNEARGDVILNPMERRIGVVEPGGRCVQAVAQGVGDDVPVEDGWQKWTCVSEQR
jgi:DNA helicase HerA-like ATPase